MPTWTTPIKLVPELYRTKTITDLSGNVRNWGDVDPNYEIYTDISGKLVTNLSDEVPEYGTTGTPMYAATDLAGIADTETIRLKQADDYVNKGWGGHLWGKVAGIMGAEAALAGVAGEYVLPWLVLNAPYLSARGWLGATLVAGNTPAWLTPTSATAIDAALAGSATGASINDMILNGPSVGNVVGTALGLGGLAFEAAPAVVDSYQSGRRAYNTYRLSRQLNQSARNWDGTVSPLYFHSPDKWYRITSSPEIHGIRELGMNVTTSDLGDMPNSADLFRRFVIEKGLVSGTGENEGFWVWPLRLRDAARNKRIVEESGEARPRKLFDLDENPSLFRKTGAAHGNRSLAAWQAPWKGTTTTTSEFPEYILEGSPLADLTIPYGRRRSSFISLPIEEVPSGARVGFKTGEMPIDGLRAFRKLSNGRYLYEGPVIPERRILLEGWPFSSPRGRYILLEKDLTPNIDDLYRNFNNIK